MAPSTLLLAGVPAGLLLMASLATAGEPIPPQPTRPDGSPNRAVWMAQGSFGVMTHYLGAPPSSDGGAELTAETWNAQIDAFDVEGLVTQVASTRAKYLLFTIGQNSGHYCSPNGTYDKIVGINPSKCSRRDLVADLAAALKAKGGTWTYDDLSKFISNPKGFVPGTAMGFAGIQKDSERADVIAYLATFAAP